MKKILLLSGIVSLSLLASCGGGGGSSSSTSETTSPSSTLQGTYTGAATAGDFATYTVNGSTLTYNVSGPVFGDINGTLTIEPMAQGAGSDTHFWKSTNNNVYMFLSKNIGLAYVPDAKDDGTDAIVVGLREVGDISNIIDKTFVYVDLTTRGMDGCEITINNDNTFTYNCSSDSEGTGCWKLDSNNNRLLATTAQSTDCSNWDGSNPEYYVVAKPSSNNGRAEFIVDHTNSSGIGIGIGLEERAYDLDSEIPSGSIQFETLDWTEQNGNLVLCQATVNVYKDNNTGDWKYSWTSSAPCSWTGEGIIEQNCYYDSNNNKNTIDGVLCAYNQTSGEYYNVMFDPKEGYYIAISSDGSKVEIGALKE